MSKRNKSKKKQITRKTNSRSASGTQFGEFEQLEDKRCLAFLGFFDGVTLDITQTADDGDTVVQNTPMTGIWTATDNSGTYTFVAATNMNVNMLDNTVNRLDIQIDEVHNGDVGLSLGDGAREVFFTGLLNEIGGNLSIVSGLDAQDIHLGSMTSAPLIVNGTGDIHLGADVDRVLNEMQLMTFIGDLSVSGVNEFNYSLQVGDPTVIPMIISDLTIDTSVEDQEFEMIPSGGSATVTGDFNFIGGVNVDNVNLDASTIMGNATIDLGDGIPFFGAGQVITIAGLIGGDLIMTAGEADFGNLADLGGTFDGNIVSYVGGDSVDTIMYNMTGPQADVFATLNGDDDVFELNMPVNELTVDFGNDPGDVFTNNVDPIDFEVDLLNYHFFNHIYTAVNDRLVMTQLANTGDVIVDNDGGISGFDWQVTTALTTTKSTIRAENLVVNLLPNTLNDLEMDLINPVIASIELNVGDGDRNIQFTGISNNPLRDITINAGAGDQQVDLSVNAPLGVATLEVNLGAGNDIVDDNAQPLIVDEDLRFSGVNTFEHDGVVSVFRDAFFDTSSETQDTFFAFNGSLFVGRDFTYLGGDGMDELRINGAGGADITGDTLINVGDSTTGGDQTILTDSPVSSFNGTFTVISTNGNTTDTLTSDAGATFDGDVSVNLGDGDNNATMVGMFGGTSVNYVGGSGVDKIVYGLSGNPADLDVMLGDDDDKFDLLAGSTIVSPLVIDFGAGNNVFNNFFGPFNFDATLNGLQGFNHSFDVGTKTLTSVQVQDLGDVFVDDVNATTSIAFTAAGNTSTLTPVDNVSVQLLNGSSTNLDVVFDSAIPGDATIDLGNGDRQLTLSGLANTFGGNLSIHAGTGEQTVDLAVNAELIVGGNLNVDLGSGKDVADENGNDLSVTGHANFIGVNTFVNNAIMNFGGDVLFDVSGETLNSTIEDNSPITIGGTFTYLGSSANDEIIFDSTTSVGGSILIDAGDGNNTATLTNIFGGTSVTYTGGTGIDLVTYGMTGSAANLNISLGEGDDVFILEAGTSILSPLTIDFGLGADTFINNFGVFTFDAVLNGLNGFNHTYNLVGSSLTSTQVEDLGNVAIDNLGFASSFRFTAGAATSSLAPADNLHVTMLDGSTSNLDLALQNALAGDLTVGLGDGVRTFNLGGISGDVGGSMNISGGAGAQTVNATANVFGDIDMNLGDGDNVVALDGLNDGAFDFTSGGGNDFVQYNMAGMPSAVNVNLDGGNDTFHLMPLATVSSLFVNFGSGTDTFINDIGALNFPTTLLGLGGFDHSFDPLSSTLTSVQTDANGGPVTFDNNGTNSAVRVIAGSTSEFGPIDNLNVTMLDNSLDSLTFDFDTPFGGGTHALAGNLNVDLGHGNRDVMFTGDNNSFGGTIDVTGGNGDQALHMAINNGLNVQGGANVNLGDGSDSFLTNGNDLTVVGDLDLHQVNMISFDQNTSISGDLNIDSSNETEHSTFTDSAIMDLVGEFNYLGGGGDDMVSINAASSIGGDINIDAGVGNNTANILGMFGGTDIRYTGGSGADNVTFGTTGNPAKMNAKMGLGDDTFTLEGGTSVATNNLRVDFQGGDDTFLSNYGQFDFNAAIRDLDGFDAIFDLGTGNLDISQVADTGDVVLDNNGTSQMIRFGNGGVMNELTPANDLRLLLQDNTSTDVTVDFDSIRDGKTTIQMRNGDRDVTLTGSSNTYTGLLRFEAADGVQNVNLAANAPLTAFGTVIVNTRDGSDTVVADNSISVNGALLFRSVNRFVNNHGLTVSGDFNMISLLENQNTSLISNNSVNVGGNISYLGGDGVDVINFKNDGATIGGFLYVDLGTAADAVMKQRINLTGGFTADSVVVDGGSSIAGTVFTTDANTTINGLFVVNFAFSTTTNTAIFQGNYNGTYATYRGGSAADFVVFGANAPNADFAAITGRGNDSLTIENTADLQFLYGDMGSGADSVDNQFPGDLPFANNIFNI